MVWIGIIKTKNHFQSSTPVKKTQRIILLLLFTIAISHPAIAQEDVAEVFPVSFKDSLIASFNTKIIYNTLSINNTTADTVVFNGMIAVPEGWKNIAGSQHAISIVIPPRSIRNTAINLVKQNNAPASWKQVKIVLWRAGEKDTMRYAYNLRAESFSAFRAKTTIQDIVLSDRPEVVSLGVHLKNSGNITDEFSLHWKNANFDIDKIIYITIEPGKDTVYYYPLKINAAEWNSLYKEVVSLYVKSNNNNLSVFEYKISRPQSLLKKHSSAYNHIPISVEGGLMSFGTNLMYSYGLKGQYKFGEHFLSVSYRSKQFGQIQNIVQRNIINAEYSYKNWKVNAGQNSISNDFISVGNGLKVTYKANEQKEFTVAGIIHDEKMSIFQSDGIALSAKYPVGKYIVTQTAEANADMLQNTNGYVVRNNIQVVENKELSVNVNAGAGLEEQKNAPDGKRTNADIAAGYKVTYSKPKWEVLSQVDYQGANFPGIRKGLNVHQHGINLKQKHSYVGLIFNMNSIRRNYFKDTLYNSDVLTFNSIRYGIASGYFDKKNTITFGTGIFQQVGQSNIYTGNRNYYLDAGYIFKMDASGYNTINFSSQNVINNIAGSHTTSDMLQINTRYFGISGAYVKTPIIGTDATGNNISVIGFNEYYNGGPSARFEFFKKTLRGNVRYLFFKTTRDNSTRSGVETNITYNTKKTGTYVNLTGYMPVTDNNTIQGLPINQTRYAMLSVSQNINVPVLTNRRYYDLKVVVFYDVNNNSKKDKDEPSLKSVDLSINDEILMTNDLGEVKYENIEGGSYKLDLINAQVEDLVPVDGSLQSLVVNNNSTYEIPFKKGKVINGNIKVIADEFSVSKYNANLVKVIATDSNGRIYKTLTDDIGNFTMYVPAGEYTVSLNQENYNDSDFKPVQYSYNVDLINHENSFVVFEIRQKKRKVRYLNQ